MSEHDGTPVLKSIVFVALGLALLVLSAISSVNSWRFQNEATHARGVVIGLNAGGSHPQIWFMTTSGRSISYAQGGLIFGYAPGEQVEVLYDPKLPQASATLDRWETVWSTPLLLGLMGLGFVVGGWTTARKG